MSGQYQVVFQGQLQAGFALEQVKLELMRLCSLAEEQAERLLASSAVVLKTCAERAQAELYQQRLEAIGMQVLLRPVVVPAHKTAEPEQVSKPLSAVTEPSITAQHNAESSSDWHMEPIEPSHSSEPEADSLDDQYSHASSDYSTLPPVNHSSQTQVELQSLPFRFTGEGGQYFGIWIVNLLLSILTLGIYSAWAKVRNKRYFYGHSHLDGENFEYTGKPLQILVGRLIAGALFILLFFSELLSPMLAIVAFVFTMAFLPWALRQSAKFNARNSWYRGLNYRFTGSLGQAYWVFLALPILSVLTLGILFPYTLFAQQRYAITGHGYGSHNFQFSARPGQYYIMALILIAVSMLGGLAIVLVAGVSAVFLAINAALGAVMMTTSIVLGYLALYVLVIAVFSVQMANLRYNHSTLFAHGFESSWRWDSYAKLFALNTLLTVLTLGLFIPFAKVRSARYAAEHLQAEVEGDLDSFVAEEAEQVSAIGEGMADFFDFDLGL